MRYGLLLLLLVAPVWADVPIHPKSRAFGSDWTTPQYLGLLFVLFGVWWGARRALRSTR